MQSYKPILLNSPKGLKSILKNKQVQTLKIIIEMYKKLLKNIDGFKEQFEEFVFEGFGFLPEVAGGASVVSVFAQVEVSSPDFPDLVGLDESAVHVGTHLVEAVFNGQGDAVG